MKAHLGRLLVAGAAGTFALCDLCGGAPAHAGTTRAAAFVARSHARPARGDSTVTLDVAGMTCGGCVLGVRKVLTRLDGVSRAKVTYEPPRAVVTFDPARASVARIVAAIGTLAYTARVSAPRPAAGTAVRP